MKFPDFRKTRYGTRQYFPLVALLAAVTTLILLLVIYTSQNLRLTRQRLEDSLLQEGLALIRAIEAGDRTGMRMRWGANNLQVLVEEIGKTPKVAYIRVIGTDGVLLAQIQSEAGIQPGEFDPNWLEASTFKINTTTMMADHGADVFEISTRVEPHNTEGMMRHGSPSSPEQNNSMSMGMGMIRRMQEEGFSFSEIAVIQLGLKMTELYELERRDIRNAILMFVVLSVFGSAALYFIVFTQNYHAMNQAFRTMRTYTQHVVDSMTNGLISLDTDGKIVTMNRQAYHILAIPEHESVEGKMVTDFMACEGGELSDALRDSAPIIEQEVRCRNTAHEVLPLRLSASSLNDDEGHQLGKVLLFRDLSEVKALEEQVKRTERLASVGRLASGVAHEIRNPLGALKGFLQYFQRKLTLQDQDKTYLTVMVNEVDRLNSVISNLLDFSRPKEPVLEPCDPGELLTHVLTLIKGDVEAKQIAMAVDVPATLPHVSLDREQMTQVLLNILLNAIQAVELHGHIHIQAATLQDTEQLEIAISDDGKGIAEEDVPRIFDPFFTTRKQGTGLGLAIAHTIIEHHGGEIAVESSVGIGTTFTIHLPV